MLYILLFCLITLIFLLTHPVRIKISLQLALCNVENYSLSINAFAVITHDLEDNSQDYYLGVMAIH